MGKLFTIRRSAIGSVLVILLVWTACGPGGPGYVERTPKQTCVPPTPQASQTERFDNGTFEQGFGPDGVALGWGRFDSGGERVHYVWQPDVWWPLVCDERIAQLVAIDTLGYPGSEADRYAGIYQTVSVAPGSTYQLRLGALLRAREADPEAPAYGYRAELGIDPNGGSDWTKVTHWIDLGIDTVYERVAAGDFSNFTTSLTATGDRLTIFIRVWKKWPTGEREIDLNLDGLSLIGPRPAATEAHGITLTVPANLIAGRITVVSVRASNYADVSSLKLTANDVTVGEITSTVPLAAEQRFVWTPAAPGAVTLRAAAANRAGQVWSAAQTVTVGVAAEFLSNPGFEAGFQPDGIGTGWSGFSSGGTNTHYRFADETWAQLVYEGSHSQLIVISTVGSAGGEADRYAGICQSVSGLTAGALYQLSGHGWLRTLPGDPEAASGYVVQYGMASGANVDWQAIRNWAAPDFGPPAVQLTPDAVKTANASILAPARSVTLCLRLWKKWATGQREVDLNLDGLSLTGYR